MIVTIIVNAFLFVLHDRWEEPSPAPSSGNKAAFFPTTMQMRTHLGMDPALIDKMRPYAGIFIHTFEIKSNLIFISNPIMAYAYPKQRKT